MKPSGFLVAVRDLKISLAFYKGVLGLEVENDFGNQVALIGGIFLQTVDSWTEFLGDAEIYFGGNDAELYFETDDFNGFLRVLEKHPETVLVHPPLEHRWGQRAVRLYDPDAHVIEVGESLATVCTRFRDSGLNEEGIARRMDISVEYVRQLLGKDR